MFCDFDNEIFPPTDHPKAQVHFHRKTLFMMSVIHSFEDFFLLIIFILVLKLALIEILLARFRKNHFGPETSICTGSAGCRIIAESEGSDF